MLFLFLILRQRIIKMFREQILGCCWLWGRWLWKCSGNNVFSSHVDHENLKNKKGFFCWMDEVSVKQSWFWILERWSPSVQYLSNSGCASEKQIGPKNNRRVQLAGGSSWHHVFWGMCLLKKRFWFPILWNKVLWIC